MKVVLIAVGVVAVLCIALSVWSRIVYRRWRRRFDALPPDKKHKEQERMYKVEEWGS